MSFPRPCLTCGLATQPGKSRCPAHEAETNRRRNREGSRRRGPTPVADKLRRELNRGYEANCEECGYRYPVSLLRVDHILPLADGGIDAMANLQVLCVDCHEDKTIRENRGRK